MPMNATLHAPVRLVVPVPGDDDVQNTIGTLRVGIVGGEVDQGDLREQLAGVLTEAGAYLAETGTFPDPALTDADPSPGEGESGSPA